MVDDETHPHWCTGPGLCGVHLGAPVTIPATAGRYRVDDTGVLFPRIEVAPAQTETGAPAVHLGVFDPTGTDPRWASGLLTLAEFRRLLERGAEVLALLDSAAVPA